ncbi:MAG TPA: peptidase [Bacteroidales bacterium]|mgnify:CR=1 FL=1|jgi:regulator of protease activity HflC (stomatin/prohibitin superfamily)|nr:peptidase [Bacteroidales bacterium]
MNQQAQQIDPRKIRTYVIIGVIVIAFFIFVKSTFIILQPTERGVVFRKYTSGLDVENVRSEGLNIIAPWNDLISFDIAEQQIEETMDVLSVDGLSISLDVSIRYRPKANEIGYLYQSFRDQYVNNLVRPELRSAVRRIIGEYTPEELYATKRQEIETAIQLSTERVLDTNHVELTALLFRSIKLPETIKQSIEDKLKADQESQKREYLQEIAEKDAQIQITQAKGKAEANRILSASLTDKILQEKGIQATEELAKSPNTKIVIVGSSKDGLPIILGGN